MERLLTQAANDLAIRSQVEETLTCILHDVELAHTLQQSVDTHIAVEGLKEKYAALQLRYQEREAVWEMERKEKERLGVALLEEIVKLSARGVREEKERRAMEMQLQRLMAEEKKSSTGDEDADIQAVDAYSPEIGGDTPNLVKATTEPAAAQATVTQIVASDDSAANTHTDVPKKTSSPKEEPAPDATKDETFNLHELNETILMSIFSYSDPLDVMHFAQINKAMFKRIDTLFGMGSTAVSSDGSDANEQTPSAPVKPQTPGSITDSSKARPPLPPTASSAPPVHVPSSGSVASGNSQSTGAAPKTSPKLFAMPSPSIPSIVGPSSGSSWLPRFGATPDAASVVSTGQSTTTQSAPTHTRSPSSGSVGSTAPESEIKLNAAMANSMASKLTPAELSVILRMREKLQKCEADAARWRLEKEDAVANLASVEAVKEFLVTRVRDTEKTVEKQKEEMKEVQRKNLADQEVIVFLDERVKKLENERVETKSKEETAKQEAADIVAKNEKKVRVLSDMLRFEREQMSSNEKEWKNTKKLLVKEVKGCRSHILALEAELEGLRKQNEQLKDRVLSPARKGKFR